MIMIYLITSMLFFKGFSELAFPQAITALGSFMMAVASAAVMFGTTLIANVRGIKWLQSGATGYPWESVFVCIVGTVAAWMAAWTVGAGFSTRFYRWAEGYNGEPFWVGFMLTLPPALHSLLVCRDILKLGRGKPG